MSMNNISVVKCVFFLTILVCVLSGTILTENGSAQTTDATPVPTATVDSELEALKRRAAIADENKKIAESEKAVAEARQAELAAKYPKPTTTPLEGDTNVDAN